MEQAEQYRLSLLKQQNVTEKKTWKDFVNELKNNNEISTDTNIPDMYKGYPGIKPGTFPNSLKGENGYITAEWIHPKCAKWGDMRIQTYVVNAEDYYDDSGKEKRIANSIKLFELFKKTNGGKK